MKVTKKTTVVTKTKAAKPAPKPTIKVKQTKAAAPKVAGKLPQSIMPPPGSSVDEYVSKVVPWQRTVIEKLRNVVKAAAPSASESIKWGQPVYEHKGPFSYIKAHATHVNFGFWRGAELDDPKRVLQGEGERMRHVRILETHALDELTLAALVKQAVALNDKKGDPTRG
ncbi:MAG TPA: DUF1801 domain-containing protein [Polyangiaceae bacterium]|jgi:hypothetical protein